MLLMEAVVSSTLLAIVVFFVINLLPAASVLLHQARFRGHALEWSRSLLEELDRPAAPVPALGLRVVPDHTFEGVTFTTQLRLSALAGESADELIQTQCTVYWKDALGDHQVRLGGYLASPP